MFAKQIIISKNNEVLVTVDLPKGTGVLATHKQSTVLCDLETYEAQRLQTFLSVLDYDAEIHLSMTGSKADLILIAFNANKFALDLRLSVIP